jgi:hypothetical protein
MVSVVGTKPAGLNADIERTRWCCRIPAVQSISAAVVTSLRTATSSSRHIGGVYCRSLTSLVDMPHILLSNTKPSYCMSKQCDHSLIESSATRLQQFHRHFTTSEKAMAPRYDKEDFKVANLYDVKGKDKGLRCSFPFHA